MEELNFGMMVEKGFEILSENNFTYNGENPIIIDFYADWCVNCKPVMVLMENLNKEYGSISFYKVNVEDDYEMSRLFNIRSLPTVMIFQAGETPKVFTGTVSKNKMEDAIRKILKVQYV